MTITVTPRPTRNGQKIYHTLEWGKGKGERRATGIFTYSKPRDQLQKNHNKEALAILETKKAQLILEHQSIGTGYIPTHNFKPNFLNYYEEYVNNNKETGNRHLQNSFTQFKKFIEAPFLAPILITENLCERFRKYLLGKYNGDTPANYFARFKRVIKAATKEGYFRINPAEDIATKSNPSIHLKENLEAEEYIRLLKTPCLNAEVRLAFIFCCYTGLRHVDVKKLTWGQIKDGILVTRIIQKKTGKPVEITLHRIALSILDEKIKRLGKLDPKEKVFTLPTHDGCNKIIQQWIKDAGVGKHITWHCARLSFSILLQDANVDTATVALLMGLATTKHVHETYKRHRPKDQSKHIEKLPDYIHPNE
ncbi:site-specific integrase [Chitinophaga sp. CB10]|uniref:site-specific integrase n=1 Tax=Chitinophaga sp. CB10 TaxID=1891659 RepID=UPI0025B7D902|nr:site-specific integrase [Chitinophaga sp. CB10]